jgi:hypothetical protein
MTRTVRAPTCCGCCRRRLELYFSDVYGTFPVWVTDTIAAMKTGDGVFADQILMVPAEKVGEMATRRHYQVEVTMAGLS